MKKLSKIEENILTFDKSVFGKVAKLMIGETPFVSTFYSDFLNEISTKKQRIFINNLSEKIDLIEKNISSNYINRDQMEELAQYALLKSINCYKEIQIKEIINILLGISDMTVKNFSDGENLITIISELSQDEAVFLNAVFQLYKKKQEEDSFLLENFGEETLSIIGNGFSDKLDFLCTRLEGKGILKNHSGMIFGANGGGYYLTYLGNLLFNFYHPNNY